MLSAHPYPQLDLHLFFKGEPSLWTVKIAKTANNCTNGSAAGKPATSVLEGNTGLYGCYEDSEEIDYYAVCNETHIITRAFKNSRLCSCTDCVVLSTSHRLNRAKDFCICLIVFSMTNAALC